MRMVLGLLALIFGIYFAACEVRGSWEFLVKDQGEINYIVLAGAGIAAALSLLPAWATLAWRGRWVLSVSLWLMFALCLATVVFAAVARTGSTTDNAQIDREKAGGAKQDAIKARDEAAADVSKAEKALADARSEVIKQAALKTCAANCAKLLDDAVQSARDDLSAAQIRLVAARAKVLEAPPPKKDSLAVRIAGIFHFVTEDQVRLYQPIAVPVLTSTLSAILTALGIWALFGVHRITEKPNGQSPQRASVPKLEPVAASISPPIAVQEVKSLAAETPTPAKQEIMEPRRIERLQIEGPRSPVSQFATSSIVRDPSGELHLRDARRAYERYCRKNIQDPIELPAFIRELASLCERTGIPARVEGKDVFLVGARLADG